MPMPSRASAVPALLPPSKSLSSIRWACEPMLVPPRRCNTARTDIDRPQPTRHRACPGFHRPSTSPSFSRARDVHTERVSRRRSVPCTTHTQRSSVAGPHVPTPSIAQNPSTSFCSCESAAQRGDPTSRSGFSSFRHSRALKTVSFLVEVIASSELQGSAEPQVKASCPHSEPSGPKISATCVSVWPRAVINRPSSSICLLRNASMSISATMSTTAGTSIGITIGTDSGAAALCPLEDEAPPSTRRLTPGASVSGS